MEGAHRVVRRAWVAMAIVALAVIVGSCGSSSGTATTTSERRNTGSAPTVSSPSSQPAVDPVAYCTQQGGTPQSRQAYWGTNLDQSQWIALGAQMTLCQFVAEDESRIYVDVDTLAAGEPTLAAAAYLAKLPLPATGNPGANPAAVDCNQGLLGTSSFGTTSAGGGGWVDLDDPTFTVVDLCMFADGSAIDQWGITYYAGGMVRGADLAPMFRFDTSTATAMFPPAQLPTRSTAP